MGIFNTLLGNASNVGVGDVKEKLADIFYIGEELEFAFSYVRDMILFTNSRIIFLDKQGLTGKKKEFYTIPYKSISRFSIETTGHFDDDSEIKIWISGLSDPIIREFSGDKNINELQQFLAQKIC